MSVGPAHRVSSAVEVFGFPDGHLGHLKDDEVKALAQFKEKATELGLYKGTGPVGDEFGTHDDATLLRFLRARRFNVDDAIEQFRATEAWRDANQLDILYKTIDVAQYDETRRLYPQWTGRRDRRGIPVYIFEVAHLNSKTMSAYEKNAKETKSSAQSDGKTPAKLLRLFSLYENLTRFVMPLSTVLTDRDCPATPITQSNNIVDISNVGLKQFWNLRSHMQDASTLATAHYPETLDRIFVIGAPSFFPTVWGWIKRWFDPITTSKIFILSQEEMKSTLESFIDPANIPKKYGGELDFNWEDFPKYDKALDDVIAWKNGYTDFPEGPMYWHDRGDSIELEAVGSVNGKARSEIVCSVRKTAAQKDAEEKQRDMLDVAAGRPRTRSHQTGSLLKVRTIDEASNAALKSNDPEQPTRPEFETFVTAREDIPTMSVTQPEGDISTAEHSGATAPAATTPAVVGQEKKSRPALPNTVSQATIVNEDIKEEPQQTHSHTNADRRSSIGSHHSRGSKGGKRVNKVGKLMEKLHVKKTNANE